MEENYVQKALNKSRVLYYGVFVVAIVAALIGWKVLAPQNIEVEKGIRTAITSMAYLYLLVAIPFALWWFNKEVKKFRADDDKMTMYTKYMHLVCLRLGLVCIAFAVNILLFYLLHDYSFLYAGGIAAVALIFCKPKKEDIANDLNPVSYTEEVK